MLSRTSSFVEKTLFVMACIHVLMAGILTYVEDSFLDIIVHLVFGVALYFFYRWMKRENKRYF